MPEGVVVLTHVRDSSIEENGYVNHGIRRVPTKGENKRDFDFWSICRFDCQHLSKGLLSEGLNSISIKINCLLLKSY